MGIYSHVHGAASSATLAVAEASNATLRALVRAVLLVAALIAALIALAIVLRLLGANGSNGVVDAVHDAANFFAGSFTTMFKVSNGRVALLLNWGIAACVFLLAGVLVARAIAAVARFLPRR